MVQVTYLDYPIYSICTDGKYVLTSGGGGGIEYGIEDQLEVHEYDHDRLQLRGSFPDLTKGVVDSIVYSPQSELWAGCLNSFCIVFRLNPTTAEPEVLYKIQTDFSLPEGRQTVVRFSLSGELLITGGDERILRVWRLQSSDKEIDRGERHPTQQKPQWATAGMQLVAELKGHSGDVKDCAITPDSQTAATCASDNTFKLWDVKTGTLLHSREMACPSNKNEKLVFRCCGFVSHPGPGPKLLLTVACGLRGPSYAITWRVEVAADGCSADTKQCRIKCLDPKPCCALAVSDDCSKFAVGFVSGTCKVFTTNFKLINRHDKHELPLTGIVFLDRGKTVISAGADYSLARMQLASEWTLRSCCRYLFCILILVLVLLVLAVMGLYILHDAANTGLQLLANPIYFQETHDGTGNR